MEEVPAVAMATMEVAAMEELVAKVAIKEVPVEKVDDVCSMHTTDIDTSDAEGNAAKLAAMEDNVIKVSETREVQQQPKSTIVDRCKRRPRTSRAGYF